LACSCGPPPKPSAPPDLYNGRPHLAGLDLGPLRGRRILIDPGHGGRFEGALGAGNTREADVNLGVGLYLWGLLADAGAEVHLTRASDRDLLPDSSRALRDDLASRVALLDSLRPDVFLSLHHNSNAALDRERNAIETYYKLEDEGPSYDLARAIHARLVQNLGIPTAAILPGNYFVLRGATTTAVLGEASYLSNPATETNLRLAAKQKLEAESYFLGLLDYFRRGVPSIVKLEPGGDTLQAGGALRFRIAGDAASVVDPLAVELWLDGRPVPAHLDAAGGELVLPGDALAAGEHHVVVQARNTRGNSARAWTGAIVVHTSPARVLVQQEPDPAPPGTQVRLRLRVQDAAGCPVADGCPVHVEGDGIDGLEFEPAVREGEVLGIARLGAGEARLRIQSEAMHVESALHLLAGAGGARFARVLDAASGEPVSDAWLTAPGAPLARTDRAGRVRLASAGDSLRVERTGYAPWRGASGPDGVVRLEPLFAGRLRGVTISLDPGGDGRDVTPPAAGVSPAALALDVCLNLRELLEAGGARAVLTRGPADEVSDLERVRRAARERASWYLRVETQLAPLAPAAVLYYPGSAGGQRLADAVARWSARRLGGAAARLQTDTRFVLQQTPCPAALVLLPGPGAGESLEMLASAESTRRRAYALFLGLRVTIDARAESLTTLEGRVESPLPGTPPAELVVLDGAEALPLGPRGAFRFDCVAPGRHVVSFRRPGAPPYELQATVAPGDTSVVRVQLPGTPR
jgi:N-acetylmuramoyl-L-alanine amidase